MIGHKYNLAQLIEDLKSDDINYTHTEFCQGRVTRWGLAWTFHNYDLLNLVPPRDKPKKKIQPLVFLLPELPNCTYNLETATNKIKSILDKLQITYEVIEKRGNTLKLNMVAKVNTWSNQRRKRRQQKRLQEKTNIKKLKIENVETKDIMNNEVETVANACLPDKESISEFDLNNVLEKYNQSSEITAVNKSDHKGSLEIQVHAFLKIYKKHNEILLETEYLNGILGKEGLHQIIQYIKNNWK